MAWVARPIKACQQNITTHKFLTVEEISETELKIIWQIQS